MAIDVTAELARIASEMGPALVPVRHHEFLSALTLGVRRFCSAEACSIALITPDESELVFVAASGGAEEKIVGRRLPLGHGIAGWVAMTGQPLGVAEVDQDPRFAADFAAELGYRPRSIIAVPMELPGDSLGTDRQIVGVLEVLDAAPPGRSPDGPADRTQPAQLDLLSLFATQAALAVESSRVFNALGRTLFEAAGRATEHADLREALGRIAADATGPSSDLAELAAIFAELSRLGAPARAAATRLLDDFLQYARSTSVPSA